MNAKRYRVSSDYYNRHNEWWYDTEDVAREKRAELLATLDARWSVSLEVFTGGKTS